MDKRGLAVAALLLSLSIGEAEAGQITVTAAAPGVLMPSNASTQLLTFDNLPVGALPSFVFSGGSLTGNGAVETTTTSRFARPAGDISPYLTVAGAQAGGDTLIRPMPPPITSASIGDRWILTISSNF